MGGSAGSDATGGNEAEVGTVATDSDEVVVGSSEVEGEIEGIVVPDGVVIGTTVSVLAGARAVGGATVGVSASSEPHDASSRPTTQNAIMRAFMPNASTPNVAPALDDGKSRCPRVAGNHSITGATE